MIDLIFQPEQNNEPLVINTETAIEMADFQVVNKKKKSRKRRSETLSGTNSAPSGGLSSGDPSMSNSTNPRNRRKSSCSMPVSDKSDSSDLDSVHSLPVSAKLGSNVNSYAERVQVLNSSSQTKERPVFLNSVEHFPELCRVNNNNVNIDNNVNVNSVSVIESKLRPAVIIPVSNKEQFYEVSGLTFGFEVNEQLLALDNDVDCEVKNSTPKVCSADSFTARFVVPVIEFNYNHDKIVSYVGQGKTSTIN